MAKSRVMEGSDHVQSSAALTPKVKALLSTRRKGDKATEITFNNICAKTISLQTLLVVINL